jgi:hypothetical protein
MLQDKVDQFVATIGYPRKLLVSAPYYPYDDRNGVLQYPNSDQPGCYIYASAPGKVYYVGKASRHLGNRIWSHIGRRRKLDEVGELYPNAENWLKKCQPDIGVWTVGVHPDHWWLASALESFLMEELRPAENLRER